MSKSPEIGLEQQSDLVEQAGVNDYGYIDEHFKFVRIDGDGDCLFSAVAGYIDGANAQDLRASAVAGIRAHMEHFSPFIQGYFATSLNHNQPRYQELQSRQNVSEDEVEQYLEVIAQQGVFADNIEIAALALRYERPIVILYPEQPCRIISKDIGVDEYRLPIFVCHNQRQDGLAHYNLLRPLPGVDTLEVYNHLLEHGEAVHFRAPDERFKIDVSKFKFVDSDSEDESEHEFESKSKSKSGLKSKSTSGSGSNSDSDSQSKHSKRSRKHKHKHMPNLKELNNDQLQAIVSDLEVRLVELNQQVMGYYKDKTIISNDTISEYFRQSLINCYIELMQLGNFIFGGGSPFTKLFDDNRAAKQEWEKLLQGCLNAYHSSRYFFILNNRTKDYDDESVLPMPPGAGDGFPADQSSHKEHVIKKVSKPVIIDTTTLLGKLFNLFTDDNLIESFQFFNLLFSLENGGIVSDDMIALIAAEFLASELEFNRLGNMALDKPKSAGGTLRRGRDDTMQGLGVRSTGDVYSQKSKSPKDVGSSKQISSGGKRTKYSLLYEAIVNQFPLEQRQSAMSVLESQAFTQLDMAFRLAMQHFVKDVLVYMRVSPVKLGDHGNKHNDAVAKLLRALFKVTYSLQSGHGLNRNLARFFKHLNKVLRNNNKMSDFLGQEATHFEMKLFMLVDNLLQNHDVVAAFQRSILQDDVREIVSQQDMKELAHSCFGFACTLSEARASAQLNKSRVEEGGLAGKREQMDADTRTKQVNLQKTSYLTDYVDSLAKLIQGFEQQQSQVPEQILRVLELRLVSLREYLSEILHSADNLDTTSQSRVNYSVYVFNCMVRWVFLRDKSFAVNYLDPATYQDIDIGSYDLSKMIWVADYVDQHMDIIATAFAARTVYTENAAAVLDQIWLANIPEESLQVLRALNGAEFDYKEHMHDIAVCLLQLFNAGILGPQIPVTRGLVVAIGQGEHALIRYVNSYERTITGILNEVRANFTHNLPESELLKGDKGRFAYRSDGHSSLAITPGDLEGLVALLQLHCRELAEHDPTRKIFSLLALQDLSSQKHGFDLRLLRELDDTDLKKQGIKIQSSKNDDELTLTFKYENQKYTIRLVQGLVAESQPLQVVQQQRKLLQTFLRQPQSLLVCASAMPAAVMLRTMQAAISCVDIVKNIQKKHGWTSELISHLKHGTFARNEGHLLIASQLAELFGFNIQDISSGGAFMSQWQELLRQLQDLATTMQALCDGSQLAAEQLSSLQTIVTRLLATRCEASNSMLSSVQMASVYVEVCMYYAQSVLNLNEKALSHLYTNLAVAFYGSVRHEPTPFNLMPEAQQPQQHLQLHQALQDDDRPRISRRMSVRNLGLRRDSQAGLSMATPGRGRAGSVVVGPLGVGINSAQNEADAKQKAPDLDEIRLQRKAKGSGGRPRRDVFAEREGKETKSLSSGDGQGPNRRNRR